MSYTTTPMCPGLLHDAAARFAADQPRDAEPAQLWTGARALGWDGLLVPESLGGAGGTLHDLAAIAEALGAHGLALPVAERCGAAPLLLVAAASAGDTARELAQGLAAQTVQLTWLQPDARSATVMTDDLPATHYLAVMPQRHALVAFTASDLPPPQRTRAVDGMTLAAWPVSTLPWDRAVALGDASQVDAATTLATLTACVQGVAALGALVTQTTTHLTQRSQFGVALSSFQVLRHKVVDLYVKYEAARGLVLDALERAAHDLAAVQRDVQLAQLYVSDAGRHCGETAVQLHGAIGMSEELPIARLCKRLLALEFRHGDALLQSRRLTDELRPRALAST